MLNGRDAWVIGGEPRPGFQARLKEAQILPKYHGRLWIDKNDLQLVKLDVEAIDTVSFGWVLARIHKGTRLVMEQTRVNQEVWLPQHISFRLDARVAVFKGYNQENEETFPSSNQARGCRQPRLCILCLQVKHVFSGHSRQHQFHILRRSRESRARFSCAHSVAD